MKIHYIGCHAVLEYDECKLLTELGHEVYCNGAYRDPRGAYTLPRPGIEGMPIDGGWISLTALHPKTNLPTEMIEPFDVLIFMAGEQNAALLQNWPKIKHKRVILRTIGQNTPSNEAALRPLVNQGLEIVRYSPKEANITNYAGGKTIIRFYKDDNELSGWIGDDNRPITFVQSLKGRAVDCHYDTIMGSMIGFPNAKIYGTGNNDLGSMNGGEMPYEELKRIMRRARVYVSAGTWPASYTLSFMEALMTGVPMVVISKKLAHIPSREQLDFYEVDEIIKDGVNGFVCDDVPQMRIRITDLMNDNEMAKRISAEGRKTAIEYFGKAKIKAQWAELLKG